ncbi:MAG: phenylacetate--CoA ligase family protein [Bacillota bacterium]
MEKLSGLKVALDAWRVSKAGPQEIAKRQRRRLSELVAFARTNSPFYAEKYRDIPENITDVTQLPPVTKAELMANFDRWVTDPAVTREGVEKFMSDPSLAGIHYAGKYMVCTTSGSTGVPAILVHDDGLDTVVKMVALVRTVPVWMKHGGIGKSVLKDRTAGVWATGGHFLAAASIARREREHPARASRSKAFSVLTPISELVRQLNDYQPTRLASYPTGLALLADEKRAGRLRISPSMIISSGEYLSDEVRSEIEGAFGVKVWNSYGCSEIPMIAYDCGHGWMHVHSDWAIIEPVDVDGRPSKPGEISHTSYVTNLANRVQPFIRYELGDRITINTEPCPCGSKLPRIQVEGRTDDVLSFRAGNGQAVRVLPLALFAVAKETPGLYRVQMVQTSPVELSVRLEAKTAGDEGLVWPVLKGRLQAFLAGQGLTSVEISRAPEPPQRDPRSGKFRHVYAVKGSQAIG